MARCRFPPAALIFLGFLLGIAGVQTSLVEAQTQSLVLSASTLALNEGGSNTYTARRRHSAVAGETLHRMGSTPVGIRPKQVQVGGRETARAVVCGS